MTTSKGLDLLKLTHPNTPLYVTRFGLMKEMVSRSNLTYTNLFYKLYGLSTSYNEQEISLINKHKQKQMITVNSRTKVSDL